MKKEELQELFRQHYGIQAHKINELPRSPSHRRYFRMEGQDAGCIGAISPDPLITKAFLRFTEHFRNKGLNVPELYAVQEEKGIYLLEDLGDLMLKHLVDQDREEGSFPGKVRPFYHSTLEHLLRFQVEGHAGLDYSVCVPRMEFDRQSVLWDMNHFKYFFLNLLGIPFDEQKLEDDFQFFASYLMNASRDHFLYRDFQARNILVRDEALFFIDYQGGRMGALQYDVASLLFEARVDLPSDFRVELLQYYLEKLGRVNKNDAEEFQKYYYGFVLVRILQAMGAYGIRGIIENIPLFLQSIPFAIQNIEWLLDKSLVLEGMPELTKCLQQIAVMPGWQTAAAEEQLTVSINSFSYKLGIPRDYSGHGGGYIFDCRTLPNPGRIEVYKKSTGRDQDVIDFMTGKQEVSDFLGKIFALADQSVKVYTQRGYTNLMI
ncbi:MAG: phosphotransferase, partial [Bacteroidales bacterium]|nr:phosphotransferase [Bacteroidales bacterium]